MERNLIGLMFKRFNVLSAKKCFNFYVHRLSKFVNDIRLKISF